MGLFASSPGTRSLPTQLVSSRNSQRGILGLFRTCEPLQQTLWNRSEEGIPERECGAVFGGAGPDETGCFFVLELAVCFWRPWGFSLFVISFSFTCIDISKAGMT